MAKEGSDTFYLKGDSLVRVKSDESFYVYTMEDKTAASGATYSEWTVEAKPDTTKSGSCTADGTLEQCTDSGANGGGLRRRILAVSCVETTIGTLKIKKVTTPAGENPEVTYAFVDTATGDLDGYTVVVEVTDAAGDTPCESSSAETDATVGNDVYFTFTEASNSANTYYLTNEYLIVEKKDKSVFHTYKATKSTKTKDNIKYSIWSIETDVVGDKNSGSCDAGTFTACTKSSGGRRMLAAAACTINSIKSIAIKKVLTNDGTSYEYAEALAGYTKPTIATEADKEHITKLHSDTPCEASSAETDATVGNDVYFTFTEASNSANTYYLTKDYLIVEKKNNGGFFTYKATKGEETQNNVKYSKWGIGGSVATDGKKSGSCSGTTFTECTPKAAGPRRMLAGIPCETNILTEIKIKKVDGDSVTYAFVVPADGYTTPTALTEKGHVDKLLSGTPCGTAPTPVDKTVDDSVYLTFKKTTPDDTYYLTKDYLIVEKKNNGGFFTYKATKESETVDSEIVSKWTIGGSVATDGKKSGSCSGTTFTECTPKAAGPRRMLAGIPCETNILTEIKIKKVDGESITYAFVVPANEYAAPTALTDELLSGTPCGTAPTPDDSKVDDIVYLKLVKDGITSYIHDKIYIVVKDENTTEVYAITKSDVGNSGGSQFVFKIPTEEGADKGGKCVNGDYKPCGDSDETNKCPTTAPSTITIKKSENEYTCEGFTITVVNEADFNEYKNHDFCKIDEVREYAKIEDGDIIKQTKDHADLTGDNKVFITKNLVYYHNDKVQFAFKVKKADYSNYTTYKSEDNEDEKKLEIDPSKTGYIPDENGNFDKADDYGCPTYRKFASLNWIINNCDNTKTKNVTDDILNENKDNFEDFLPISFTKSGDIVYLYDTKNNKVGKEFGNITTSDSGMKTEDISSTIIPSILMLFIIFLMI